MNVILLILSCGIAVSIDSMVAGFALGVKQKINLVTPTIVAVITFVLCTLSMLFASYISRFASHEVINYVGSGILIATGITTLFKKDSALDLSKGNINQAITVGFAVGLDAAVASISLTLMDSLTYIVPIVFALLHFIAVLVGIALTKIKGFKEIKHTNIISAVVLIGIGIIKIFS